MSYYRVSNGKYFLNVNGTIVDIKHAENIANRYKSEQSALHVLENVKHSPKLLSKVVTAGVDINTFNVVKLDDFGVTIDDKVKNSEIESLEEFTNSVKDLVYEKLVYIEQEQEDILHVIENGGIDAVTIAKCMKRLKEVRKDRRIVKNIYTAMNVPSSDLYAMRTPILNDILLKEN